MVTSPVAVVPVRAMSTISRAPLMGRCGCAVATSWVPVAAPNWTVVKPSGTCPAEKPGTPAIGWSSSSATSAALAT